MPSLPQEDLDQARALEGSVFDDTWSKLRRFGASDPTGGLGANPMGGMGVGIVRNEAHPAFQMLQRTAPREADHLQNSSAIVRYVTTSPKELPGMNALTIPMEGFLPSSLDKIPISAFKEMDNAPGSSFQLYPRGRPIDPSTPLHEAGHSLRLARSGGQSGIPNITADRAADLLRQAERRGLIDSGLQLFGYGGDASHAALDAIAKMRAGGFKILPPTGQP
jgi:hypothetical protein